MFYRMASKTSHTYEAVCNSISDDYPSGGVPLERRFQPSSEAMPLIAAACESILMFGVVMGVAA